MKVSDIPVRTCTEKARRDLCASLRKYVSMKTNTTPKTAGRLPIHFIKKTLNKLIIFAKKTHKIMA